MCLVKVKQEEDVIVPYRPVRRRSPSPVRHRRSTHRVSREVIRESRPASSTYLARPPSATYVAVPAPAPLAIPAPQPVPVFVQPPPLAPPPPASHISSHHGAHYVEVSPRSSVTSHSPSRSDYVVHEREYRRERNYSPESSPRYETFRYVEGAGEPRGYERLDRRERSRSRVRERSMSRGRDYGYEDPRGSYRETSTRIVVNDGRRRSEYAR